ncbi:MFS general substrate transporter [Aaosphaeria arxii CBS 175.79]|uniref:MFS general substrate transporter n=1 Tax=Aaosphaeria arxii CBS 175.79 TaxID=1450172 RepID=A0A6A5XB22_9PLEO|nr:MFS general substrate transporter [Aaosphaeria arxii CBS 175.79]KAF2010110.1 MFS general substrate transporter [Aaosphaeria arxii CBS 175.79]
MSSTDHFDDPMWPPGTVRLQEEHTSNEIILQPQPSQDPNDPLNWSNKLKYLNFGLAALYALIVFALIDAATPTWDPMHEELGYSYDDLNNSYAAGCAGLALGAVALIPFAHKYGRRPIYLFSCAIQFGVCIWSARQKTVADLILVNIFSCFLGALAETIVQMTIADMIFVNQRALMNSLYFWSTRIGASLTPLAAGYVTVDQGWRWVWWWLTIIFGALIIVMFFGYEETKFVPPATEGIALDHCSTLENNTTKDGKDIKDPEVGRVKVADETTRYATKISIDPTIPRKSYLKRLALTTSSPGSLNDLLRHCYQPFQILFTIPGVLYMSLLYGGMMVTNNILVTTVSTYMTQEPYNFSPDQIGLMSLAPFIGSTLGTLICGPVSDWSIVYLTKRNKGIYEPEMRLWLIIVFATFLPVGMILLGVGLEKGWTWPILAVCYALCSFGIAPAGTLSLTYITDAYTQIVGDAMVGVTFIRNLCSTIMIFAKTPWIAGIGLQNTFIMIGVILASILFGNGFLVYYGKYFRYKYRATYQKYAMKQFEPRVNFS